ncbi:MAG: acyl-CoA dehydrogenase family protein [Thermaurantiacus sp.]
MNFDFTESQALLRETVSRWASDHVGGDTHRLKVLRAAPGGFDRSGWEALGELGVLALPFAECDGGLGGGPVEAVAVAEPLGRALTPEPVTECLMGAGTLFAAAASPAVRARHLPAIMSGHLLLAAAITEQRGRTNIAHVETRAKGGGEGWTLAGAKSAVWQGGAADAFLVTARLGGEPRDRAGIALFLVPRDADGIEVRPWRAADGSVAVELTLRDVTLGPDAQLSEGLDAVEAALVSGWLAASAEMLGGADLLLETTLAYVKGREQFGRPIGNFQVIQHRLTDCYVAIEQARSMVYRAALAPDADRARAVTGCHAFVSEAARLVAHEAVQFHGGMGVTDELLVGHALKRIQLLSRLWTDPDSAMLAWAEAA